MVINKNHFLCFSNFTNEIISENMLSISMPKYVSRNEFNYKWSILMNIEL